jgi:hypothetical protein
MLRRTIGVLSGTRDPRGALGVSRGARGSLREYFNRKRLTITRRAALVGYKGVLKGTGSTSASHG